ncbi:MAG TPA: monovalent cation/H(+) antiporter subunit G [Rhodanobacteraceae bacterium]|nr:monovalent cation/H(+) antiporter subunit G [Rhodanobacteraceae bacterium]
MNLAIDGLLAFAVLMAWIGAIAFLRLRTNFERLHVITFVNMTAGAAITIAAVLHDGLSGRTFKCIFIFIVIATVGALLSHATSRALHLRDGERR